ncbi:MAG TPA: septation protein SepH [Acidimicrobiales bacterium]|nr:septation protein SepH [Acidimicrobiales bacterium]
MHDLTLVGFTTDRRGLIFRSAAGARGDSYVVPLTDELISLVAELGDEETEELDGAGGDEVEEVAGGSVLVHDDPGHRPRSMLSVRDIQARLRAGESTAQVASEAGVDDEWIERFAPPVRAEQRRVVDQALECHLERARAGQSAVPLRRAVGMAMADKGIAFTITAFEAAWSSHLIGHDRWAVTFTYRHRGRDHRATWIYDSGSGELTTSDRTASQIGYVPGTAKVRDDAGVAVDGIVGDPAATTQIGVAEPAPPRRRRASRSATAPAGDAVPPAGATKAASKGKRSKGRPASATRTAAKKAAAKKAVPKKAAPKKAATKKRAGSGKKAAPKRAATKKKTGRKTAATKKKTGTTKKTGATKTGATKAPAKTRAATRSAAPKKAVPRKAAAPKRTSATKTPAPASRAGSTAAAPTRPAPAAATRSPRPTPAGPPAAPPRTTPPSEPPVPAPAPADVLLGDDERLRIRSRRAGDRPARAELPVTARDVAPRPGAVDLDEVPLAPAPHRRPEPPSGNGRPPAGERPPELERIPDAPGVVDTTAADRADARRARAAERNAPTVQFRSGSAVPVRRADANGAGRVPSRRRQLRAR